MCPVNATTHDDSPAAPNHTSSTTRTVNPNHTAAPPRHRWVKVSVDEDLFHHLHIVAAQSRMRITPYLRRYLAEAEPFQEVFRR